MAHVSLAFARSTLSASWLLGVLSGCFDVQQVDAYETKTLPPPRVIDNFDDDVDNTERQPTDTNFGPWHCPPVQSTIEQTVSCSPGPGIEDTPGRELEFDILDPADDQLEYPFMELVTGAVEPQDFSHFERFVFSAALRLDPSVPPVIVRLGCRLYCSRLAPDAWVEAPVLVASNPDWHTYERRIAASFQQPQWQKDQWLEESRQLIDATACIEHVDALGIVLSPDLLDGDRSKGTLDLDEIYVQ